MEARRTFCQGLFNRNRTYEDVQVLLAGAKYSWAAFIKEKRKKKKKTDKLRSLSPLPPSLTTANFMSLVAATKQAK